MSTFPKSSLASPTTALVASESERSTGNTLKKKQWYNKEPMTSYLSTSPTFWCSKKNFPGFWSLFVTCRLLQCWWFFVLLWAVLPQFWGISQNVPLSYWKSHFFMDFVPLSSFDRLTPMWHFRKVYSWGSAVVYTEWVPCTTEQGIWIWLREENILMPLIDLYVPIPNLYDYSPGVFWVC